MSAQDLAEARDRERVAIASWDEERKRSLREARRVAELRKLLGEVYTWAICAGCHDDDLLRRVKAAAKGDAA